MYALWALCGLIVVDLGMNSSWAGQAVEKKDQPVSMAQGKGDSKKEGIKQTQSQHLPPSKSLIDEETELAMKSKQLDHLTVQEIEKIKSQTRLQIVLAHIQRYVQQNLTVPRSLLDEQKNLEAENEKFSSKGSRIMGEEKK